jgi:hypothetical protein
MGEYGFPHRPPWQRGSHLDELDGVLLSATEKLNRGSLESLSPADVEQFLASLWGTTFTKVAAAQEAWLERAFISVGVQLSQRFIRMRRSGSAFINLALPRFWRAASQLSRRQCGRYWEKRQITVR